jgi:hypothetical protein
MAEKTKPGYTVSPEGNYVAHDGWVCPKNCDEFFDRYPNFIADSVNRNWHIPPHAKEDLISELSLHFIQRNTPGRFNPAKLGGRCSEKLYLNYLWKCIRNKQQTINKKRMVDALGSADSMQEARVEARLVAGMDPEIAKLRKKIAANHPALLRIFDLRMQGATFSELHRATGISHQNLYTLFNLTIPKIHFGLRIVRTVVYRRLEELGEFNTVPTTCSPSSEYNKNRKRGEKKVSGRPRKASTVPAETPAQCVREVRARSGRVNLLIPRTDNEEKQEAQ